MQTTVKRFRGSCYRADDRTMFTYSVEVKPTLGASVWWAVVSVDGQIRARLSDPIFHAFTDPKLNDAICAVIDAKIRDRVGIG